MRVIKNGGRRSFTDPIIFICLYERVKGGEHLLEFDLHIFMI